MLSVAPALAVIISIYGLVVTPAEVHEQINTISALLPADARSLITSQLQAVASARQQTWGLSIVLSGLVSP